LKNIVSLKDEEVDARVHFIVRNFVIYAGPHIGEIKVIMGWACNLYRHKNYIYYYGGEICCLQDKRKW
jgi:hypothetical protein